jgi:hypothetical protein
MSQNAKWSTALRLSRDLDHGFASPCAAFSRHWSPRCNTGGHTPTFDELMGEVGGCLTAISRRLPSLPSRSETSDAR